MGRRIFVFLIIFSLLGGCVSAQADEAKTVYASDFSKGTDGWYGRGAVSTATREGTLVTTDRQSDWNSPGRDFDLIEGGRYEFSVEVKQDEMNSANFMVSIAHTANGAETYENLAFGSAAKREWTTLRGSYTAGPFDRNVLYVETTGAPTLAYEIRNFVLMAPEGLPEPKPTEPPMTIEANEDVPGLKDVYSGKFDFGAAAPQSAFRNSALQKLMKKHFSILTPENELKPDSVLDVADSKKRVQETGDESAVCVHFDAAKALLDFAKINGIKVHGHTLLWHSQTPEALFHEGYDTSKPLCSREVMLARMENYIRGIMETLEENYPGVVVSWDVLNEAVDDGTAKLRQSKWYRTVGEDYPLYAFEYARKYAPEGTMLYYNDYSTAYPAKRAGIIRLLKTLIEGGNIDGYGFQMHHSSGEPSMEMITKSVEDIAALGLKLRVSELDVGISNKTEASYMAQARKYADIMKLMLRFGDQTEAVQVWGLTDTMSWRSREFPLLFDGSRNPKPAFYAVADPEGYGN